MSFFPNIAPLAQKLDQFSQTHGLNQQQMIALLKQISQQLASIQQILKENK
jgi:hypothetical protein